MPPSRPPKKDPTFDPSKYEFEFSPYNTSATPFGYEGLLDMFPRSPGDDDETDSGHIKRVSNMFFVFRTHFTKTYKNVLDSKTGRPRHPIPEKDISRMAAWVWNFQMTTGERRPYFDTYLQLKYEHEKDHPDYKYQPTRPEDAERIKNEKTRHRIEELQRQKEEATARRARDEEDRKIAKMSKKKWAAMKREQRKRNEENAVPELRLDIGLPIDYASASPYSFASTPMKPMGYLGVNSPTFTAHSHSRSPSDLFVLSSGLREPTPVPMPAHWSSYNSKQSSRQGTPAVRQPIEVPKLIATPGRQEATLPRTTTQTIGLGLQFSMPAVLPYRGIQEHSVPSSITGITPIQTPARNLQSSFVDAYWRPVAGLPPRAQCADNSTASWDSSAMTVQYQGAATYSTPPQTASAKRIRALSPMPVNSKPAGKPVSGNATWQTYTPVTPVPLSSSIAKERMIWGVSPQSEKVDKRLDFGARTSPAPEDDDARGLISPRQASSQHNEVAISEALVDVVRPPAGHKRKLSENGQGGRSREPSYSGAPKGLSPSDGFLAHVQNELEDVFAAQRRALQTGASQDFGYMGKPSNLPAGLFAGASADMADWMGQSSMEYLPPPTSHSMSPEGLASQIASPRTHRSDSTDAYELVSTFSAGFVHGTNYENRVGDIANFAFGSGGPMGLMAEIRPVRSLSNSGPSVAASPRDENVSSEDDSERAMSQFFDFSSGSDESPNHLFSQSVSPVAA
ncbi:hypothetical protein CALCODRAFT_518300 [Calocera cornea HHB12733]|uniref:HMG box domain-containing protein n=1 Tax=Calocera cornea HHB12733 TaxID=1353952 RepID=A0A165F4G9_9BASI|nr:hypothetical protein CALCODRAFT_518300 [Calocera cornea HHB12733]